MGRRDRSRESARQKLRDWSREREREERERWSRGEKACTQEKERAREKGRDTTERNRKSRDDIIEQERA